MLYYTILYFYYIVLFCIALCCLYYILYYIILYYIILYYIILYYILYHSIIPNILGLPTGPYDRHQVNGFLTDLKGYYRRIVEDAEKKKV